MLWAVTRHARLTGDKRKFIKGQKYVLLSHRENLSPEGKHSLKSLLAANNISLFGNITNAAPGADLLNLNLRADADGATLGAGERDSRLTIRPIC